MKGADEKKREADHERLTLLGATSPFRFHEKKVDSHVQIDGKWHEQLEIKYIKKGQLEVLCGAKSLTAQPGDVLVFNPCEWHFNRALFGEAEYDILLVDLTSFLENPFLGKTFLSYADGGFGFSGLIRGDEHLTSLLHALFSLLPATEEHQKLLAYGAFLSVFAHLLSHHTDKDFLPPTASKHRWSPQQENVILTALHYLCEHYKRSITLAEMADACYVSTSHLCRRFKEALGRTPMEYLTEFRIRKATSLLETTDTPIHEIAAEVGFHDVGYFCRLFRRRVAISPAAYRRERALDKNQV